MAKMAKAHCDETMFGVESGCQRMRDVLKKRVSTDQCENAKNGPKMQAYLSLPQLS